MALTSSSETAPLGELHGRQLLDIARRSIHHGLERGSVLPVGDESLAPALLRPGASFVTLHRKDTLRGCIGSLEACQSLAQDVAENAHGAAFRDPRFPPLGTHELHGLEIEISVLSAPVPVEFSSEEDLVRQLRPGLDGLILEAGDRRGTFLPVVWHSIPDPVEFLVHLKRKAGLPAAFWSPDIRIYRYSTVCFR